MLLVGFDIRYQARIPDGIEKNYICYWKMDLWTSGMQIQELFRGILAFFQSVAVERDSLCVSVYETNHSEEISDSQRINFDGDGADVLFLRQNFMCCDLHLACA